MKTLASRGVILGADRPAYASKMQRVAVRLLSVSAKRVSSVYVDVANKSNRSLLYDNHATARKSDQKRQGLLDNESWQLQ